MYLYIPYNLCLDVLFVLHYLVLARFRASLRKCLLFGFLIAYNVNSFLYASINIII